MFARVAGFSPGLGFPPITALGSQRKRGPVTPPPLIIPQMVGVARPVCNGSQAALPSEAVCIGTSKTLPGTAAFSAADGSHENHLEGIHSFLALLPLCLPSPSLSLQPSLTPPRLLKVFHLRESLLYPTPQQPYLTVSLSL